MVPGFSLQGSDACIRPCNKVGNRKILRLLHLILAERHAAAAVAEAAATEDDAALDSAVVLLAALDAQPASETVMATAIAPQRMRVFCFIIKSLLLKWVVCFLSTALV